MSGRLLDVDAHLWQPIWPELNLWEKDRRAVDKLRELGHSFNKMASNKLSDPVRWLLSDVGLKLNLQDCVREPDDIVRRKLFERPVDSNVCSSPVISSPVRTIFSDHGELCVQRNTHASVTR